MSREGWSQNMPCNPKTLQKAARALQPSWCLQGYKPLFCPIAQGHVHSSGTSICVYNQARHSHPCRWLCSAFLSFEPFFHPWRPAVNLFCSPGSQGMSATAKAQGTAGTLGTERAPHPWAPRRLARACSAVPAREGAWGCAGGDAGMPGMAACKHDSCKRGSP